jgi:threonine synthase
MMDSPPRVVRVDDEAIRARIAAEHASSGYVACPHTACALEAHARLSETDRRAPWIVAATAHPYKFADIVEPIIGATIAPSSALESVLSRASRSNPCNPDLPALAAALDQFMKADA